MIDLKRPFLQIIATSHDLSSKGKLTKWNPIFSRDHFNALSWDAFPSDELSGVMPMILQTSHIEGDSEGFLWT